MLLRWVQGCDQRNDLGQRVEGVGKTGGGSLGIVIGYYCLRTKFLSIGPLLPRLSLQEENRFLIGEIGLDLGDSEIGLVFLLVKEDEVALVVQPLYYT